ncbi:hypothetical protein ACTNDY_03545 [Tissierellaceae bacterium HCP3S3_D8]
MKKIQVTLTVEEGKEIISMGILNHPVFLSSLEKGKILFKGGTTVSRITEKLIGVPLKISGRITARGTVSSKDIIEGFHSIVYTNGEWFGVDDNIVEIAQKFTENDLIICGANAIDYKGNAAIMAGSPGGGNVGRSLSAWYTEGVKVLIATGLEKMIFGDLDDMVKKASRKGKSMSWGMAVGLMPLPGELFTEIEAIKQLANVECFQIGAGGIGDAQGSITLEIWPSTDKDYDKIIDVLKEVKSKNREISGMKESLIECEAICSNCKRHIGCGYKSQVL